MELIKLNIQMFAANSYTITSATETAVNIDDNTSYVYVAVKIATNSGTYNNTGNAYYTITASVGDQSYTTGNMYYKINTSSTLTFDTILGPFKHNSDGSLDNVSISSFCRITNSTNFNTSASVTMSTIPRATSCPSVAATIGNQVTVSIASKSSSFTHVLDWSFGSYSGSLQFGSSSSINWTPSLDLHNAIPNAKIGTGTLELKTYNSGTQVGSTSTNTLTLYANEAACTPTISGSAIDNYKQTIELTGDNTKFVKYLSDAYITTSAESKYGASISSKTVNGISFSGNNVTIEGTQTSVFKLQVTDSRGYSSPIVTIGSSNNLIDYVPLSANISISRDEPTNGKVNLSYNGNYFNGNFSSDNANTLTAQYCYKEKDATSYSSWINLSPTISGNTFKQELTLPETYDYQKAYNILIRFQDKYYNETNGNSAIYSNTILEGIPVYWWNKTSFNVECELNAKSVGETFLNAIYPIGSIYMSMNNTSPEALFGGTWESLKDRFLVGAGNSYSVGATGGANSVTLTANQSGLRSHNHSASGSYSGANFYIRHGKNSATATVEGGTNTSIDTGVGSTWSNGYETSSYSHQIDRVNIGGSVGVSVNSEGNWNASESHENRPPYLAVYMWRRTA